MIRVVETPLAECPAEAILRPVRTDWPALTSQVRRMEQAAGSGWVERCAGQGELPLGSAAITDGGQLEAAYVIHVAVSSPDDPASPRSVRAALENGLRRAEEWGIESVAMPLLGTGPGALDPEMACRAMDEMLRAFAGPETGRTVLISAEDDPSLEASRRAWGDLEPEAGAGAEAG